MSLQVNGVWAAGVWASTVWAQCVWFEPGCGTTVPVIDGAGNLDWLNKGPRGKKRKSRVIRFSDFETREAYETALEKAAQSLAAESIPVSAITADGSVEDDELEDDEIVLMTLMRILH